MANAVEGLYSNYDYYVDGYGEDYGDYSTYSSYTEGMNPTGPSQYYQDQYVSSQPGPGVIPGPEGIGEVENSSPTANPEAEAFKKQCQALLDMVKDSENLSPEQQQDMETKLNKLITSADLHPDSLDLLQSQLDELSASFEAAGNHAPLANDLAQRYGQDPQAIEDLAKKYNLDLSHLPNPPTESVYKFLAELDPQVGDAVKSGQQAVDAKKQQDAAMVQKAKDRNTAAVMSKKDIDDTDLSSYDYLLKAQTGEDQASLDMNEKLDQVKSTVQNSLQALYGKAGVELDSEAMMSAFQIDVPKLPEDAPELVPMAWDGRGTKGQGNFDRMTWPEWVSSYPKIEYNGKADKNSAHYNEASIN